MRSIEKSIFNPPKDTPKGVALPTPKGMASPRDYLAKMLPKNLIFKDLFDFARVGQILSVMFKEMVWGWEPKNKEGNFAIGKDYIRINLKNMPVQAKKRFNDGRFYLDQRRAFIIS